MDFPTPPFWFATAMMRDVFGFRGREADLGRGFTGGSFTFVSDLDVLGAVRAAATRGAFEEAGVAGEALRLVTTAP
ncbi:MAG TPA: hypothetical protein VFT27_09385 [Actinomycetota bacterium]|nr:hypothetical protein [Actinomycetota bacterium]